MSVARVSVLIVGAGYAGLAGALLLAWRGVKPLVVERRATLCRHPRAHGINRRTMEVLRVVDGLEADLFSASRAAPNDANFYVAERVTGPALKTILTKDSLESSPLSPAKVCSAGQDRVEPALLRHARGQGADVRFSTTLLSYSTSENGVEAELRDEVSGETYRVAADYLLACDGAHSAIRRSLGIEMRGPGVLTHAVSILFEADLPKALGATGFLLCYLRNSDFTGAFVTCDDPRMGVLNVEYAPNAQSVSDFDPKTCASLVRAALGVGDLDVDILDVQPWEMSALIATRLSSGRVFLVGDAAHTVPPVGGMGGQLAIQDAADLAWKLALVLRGAADPGLLQSYEAERAPVARLTLARQIANYVQRMRPDREDLRIPSEEVDFLNVAMGYRYRSRAVLCDDDEGAATEDPRAPSVAPGFRLPHAPLIYDGREISLHDLIGRDFVVIVGRDAGRWTDAARELAENYPLSAYRLGADLQSSADLHETLRLSPHGALLVRPDGFVAWKTQECPPDPEVQLAAALAQICARASSAHEGAIRQYAEVI